MVCITRLFALVDGSVTQPQLATPEAVGLDVHQQLGEQPGVTARWVQSSPEPMRSQHGDCFPRTVAEWS